MAKLKKRDDGRYQKNIIVGIKPNGKYIRKTLYGKTQKDLDTKIHELTNDINAGIAVWQSDITFAQLAKIWMEQYHPMETESWKYKENSTLNHHLLPAIGGMHVKDLKQVHLQCIISNLATKGYATGTMKKIKQTAERVMRVAVDSDLIVKNPFIGIKIPYVEPEARRALTESEIKLITQNWRGTKMGPAAMIMLYAGLRIGEVLALEWKDIDFNARTITVSKARAVLKNQPHIKKPKTKAGIRVIPMPEVLYEALWSVRRKQGLVCPNTKGTVMSGVSQKNAWSAFLNHLNECAGGSSGAGPRKPVRVIEHITAHMLRHTYATMLFDAGVDIKSAQRFLGHADVEVTLSIYTHLTKYKEEQAIQVLDKHLNERNNEMQKPLLRVL